MAYDLDTLLSALGNHVRELRRDRGWSRRALAEQTGISERFLADVESGKGNPSLLRLHQLATTLGNSVSALLAAAEERALGGRGERLALLGLRGAGKSSIGQAVAATVGCSFLELDAEVERRAGLSLGQLFELGGEEDFRHMERETLRHTLADGPRPLALATGGGLVTDRETFDLLRAHAFTIWLRATPEDHWDRVVAQGDTRPMRGDDREGAFAALRRILAQREPRYREADATVDTSGKDIAAVAAEVAALWQTARDAS